MILLPLQVPRHDPRVHGWHRANNLREAEGPRSHSFSQRERTGTALRPKVALPALFPRGPAPYAQMVMFARLTHSAALPSLPLPLLARSPTFLFTSSQGAAALPLARARHRTPSLPLSLDPSALSETVCAIAGFVSVSAVAFVRCPSVLRADGGRAGARTSHMPVCHPQAHPRLSQARSYSKSGALQRWIPGYRRCTDRPTVQPN